MARVKRSLNAKKKRRVILEQASGYRGQRSRLYRKAKEQVLHSMTYAYAGRLEALHEPVVGQPVRPRRGVDPLDPQPAEVALAVLAVAVGVGHRVEDLLLGLAVQP